MKKVKITFVKEGTDKNGHEYKLGLYNGEDRSVSVDESTGLLDFRKASNNAPCVFLYDKSQWDLLQIGTEIIID